MDKLFVGDNGTLLTVTVSDDEGTVDLSTATSVMAKFVRADRTTFDKTLTISDGPIGKCTVILTAGDLVSPGTYVFQVTVTFSNGNVFSGPSTRFHVSPKLT